MNVQQIIAELQTLDSRNPGGWPLWVRISASVLGGLLVLMLGTYALVKPVYEELQAEEARELTLRKQFEENQGKAAALDAFKAQLAEMEKDFGAMLKQLPSKSEVANLLNDISQARVASSLEEELFQPQPDSPREFYAEIPNKIIVTGTYHEMGNFASAIAALPRIVTIDDVEITVPPKNDKANWPEGTLRMQALAKTYRYLDEEEVAEAESAAAAASKGKKPTKAK
ncbi:type 4a pilus biogenesis protein PilO [Solimonas sp. SE-A11]|uniref:type 4a pilus biogenesis protein PilO n=1 Tax=Solimonas sp. SE-A11 TaxID=3054954 RepID=UPI00259CFCCE|nr:type 4a pilus biogenesis protein PilO [Solimonas sp. SE-A11]MDM4770538.1 type 4a pilus biogenesis protein PilO [Solimonas sp. SE-A11]